MSGRITRPLEVHSMNNRMRKMVAFAAIAALPIAGMACSDDENEDGDGVVEVTEDVTEEVTEEETEEVEMTETEEPTATETETDVETEEVDTEVETETSTDTETEG